MDDAEFLEALARGEPQAYEEAFRRYGSRVATLARRQLGSALRAKIETQDIVQSVFREVAAGACRARFDSERAFLGWLGLVVDRKIVRAARYFTALRRDRKREVAMVQGCDLPDLRAGTPSAIVSREEDRERLILALAELREQDREVVVSRILLALPWEAVASLLGTTVEAAQMRLTRAYRRLKLALTAPARAESFSRRARSARSSPRRSGSPPTGTSRRWTP